jgi:hypothetical protein
MADLKNTFSVGMRDDGRVSILSSPDVPGGVQATHLIMTREIAVWLAREILHATRTEQPEGDPR